jgi:hypothetical protein
MPLRAGVGGLKVRAPGFSFNPSKGSVPLLFFARFFARARIFSSFASSFSF